MEILSNKYRIPDFVLIIIGTFLMAISINVVYEPMSLVTGGITGLSIVIKYLSKPFIDGGIPIWLSNVILNVPLFLIAIKLNGISFIKKTLFATVSLTVALYIIPVLDITYTDYLLAAIFGAVIGGVGLGLVFATTATTGGTDLLGMIIHLKFKHITAAQLLAIIDGIIVIAGGLTFGIQRALYAVIAVYITSKVIDSILEGLKFAKLAYIISDQYESIAKEIMDTVDRGVTSIHATGMYSNEEKKMLFCVVSKKEIVNIIDIVAKKDPSAFVIVSDVREVLGEGFIEYKQ